MKKIIKMSKLEGKDLTKISGGENMERVSLNRSVNEIELRNTFFNFNVSVKENGFKYIIFDRVNSSMYLIKNTKKCIVFSKYYTNEECENISNVYTYDKPDNEYNNRTQINWDIDNYNIIIHERNISVSKDGITLFIIENNLIKYFYNDLSETNIKYDKWNNISDMIIKDCIKHKSMFLKCEY